MKAKVTGCEILKIVSWNCSYGRFPEKFEQIVKLAEADVYIIQECPNPNSEEISNLLKKFGIQKPLWVGHKSRDGTSGLGIFVKNDRNFSELEHDIDDGNLRYYLFCKVDDLNILGIWAHTTEKGYYSPYLREYLEKNEQRIDNNCVIAGDLNLDMKPENGRIADVNAIYKLLDEKGLISAYHKQTGESFGKETEKTLHKNGPSTHIDYVFAANEKIKYAELGQTKDWISYSDHVPLLVSLETSNVKNTSDKPIVNTDNIVTNSDVKNESIGFKTKTVSSKQIKTRSSDSDAVKRGLELIEQNGVAYYYIKGYSRKYQAKTPATLRKDDKEWGIERFEE
ncbi:hypothetical protein MmiHf6_06220 [Methanimicrococcus hongohii]|uniref:Endonuclease/exonuclease/phosphatase domain-containing protein n=1 Tax=Methanimicrococcus hongohii TaxID=3028295 RepID=A0AA96ZU16_9EURY|nr:endonuclease/exonuclease/phosphatase family protein [Methanimicrococcus sp. Hf6]WNY23317.1 hypothetical protein MmiHf6_06220 [Methanimicrococcus sp. Hf6]